jgi:hypothetical protein
MEVVMDKIKVKLLIIQNYYDDYEVILRIG